MSTTTWQESALCAGLNTELFYPEHGVGSADVQEFCFHCPVQAECLEAAVAGGEEYGIWGGVTESERREIIRQQRRAS